MQQSIISSQHIQLNPRLTSHPHRHHHISRLSTPTTHIRKLHSSHSLSSVPTLSSFNHTDSDSSLFDSPNALQSSVFSPSISSSSSSFSSSSFSTYSSSVQQPTSIQTTESGRGSRPQTTVLRASRSVSGFPTNLRFRQPFKTHHVPHLRTVTNSMLK